MWPFIGGDSEGKLKLGFSFNQLRLVAKGVLVDRGLCYRTRGVSAVAGSVGVLRDLETFQESGEIGDVPDLNPPSSAVSIEEAGADRAMCIRAITVPCVCSAGEVQPAR